MTVQLYIFSYLKLLLQKFEYHEKVIQLGKWNSYFID